MNRISRRGTWALCALMLAGGVACSTIRPGAGPASPPEPELKHRVDAAVDQALADQRIVGAVVLVSRDGKLIYHRAAGMADRENARAMEENEIFRIASVTKMFTSSAVLALVDQGKIGLDDPVTRFLPDFRPRLADGTAPVITIRQLLSHTSGLGYGFLEAKDGPLHKAGVSDGVDLVGITLDENLRRLATVPLLAPPGSAWNYSLSTDVLGAVLEKVAGEPLPKVVERNVTRPLGLKEAGFKVSDPARLAAAYMDGPPPRLMKANDVHPFTPAGVSFSPGRALDPSAFPSGGGGMVATAGDVLALLEAIRTGGRPILSEASVKEMTRDQLHGQPVLLGPGWGFGLGPAVLNDPAAAKSPLTAGSLTWGGVYGATWFVDPTEKLSAVILTNTAVEGMVGKLPQDVEHAIYGK